MTVLETGVCFGTGTRTIIQLFSVRTSRGMSRKGRLTVMALRGGSEKAELLVLTERRWQCVPWQRLRICKGGRARSERERRAHAIMSRRSVGQLRIVE